MEEYDTFTKNKVIKLISKSGDKHKSFDFVSGDLAKQVFQLLQCKQDLKGKFLQCHENLLFFTELQKPQDNWIQADKAEKMLLEAKDIVGDFKSVVDRRVEDIADTVRMASNVMQVWKTKMATLSQKIVELENQVGKVFSSSVSFSNERFDEMTDQESTSSVASECAEIVLETAKEQQKLMQERLRRLENEIAQFKDLSAAYHTNENTLKKALLRSQDDLTFLQEMSGFKCKVLDDCSVQITLETNKTAAQEDDADRPESTEDSEDCQIHLILTFAENSQGLLEISDVECDRYLGGIDKFISDVKHDKDIPKFIVSVQKAWESYLPVNKEIARIRRSHAIDWIPDEGSLQLIIKNKSSIVCTLKVPPSYPLSGKVTLDNILTHSAEVEYEKITPPEDDSLYGWVQHLENIFGHNRSSD